MSATVIDGLFSDEVFTATELNRRVGTVLDHACLRPVTISRNNELFALVTRDYAARMLRTLSLAKAALAVLSEARAVASGGAASPPYSWLEIYDKDDLERLISEVFETVGNAASGAGEWNEVDAVIHEWKESALVAKSGALDHAMFNEPAEEFPLTNPDEILRYLEPLPPAGEGRV